MLQGAHHFRHDPKPEPTVDEKVRALETALLRELLPEAIRQQGEDGPWRISLSKHPQFNDPAVIEKFNRQNLENNWHAALEPKLDWNAQPSADLILRDTANN